MPAVITPPADLVGSPRLSLRDAARLLGVSMATIWRWVRRPVRGARLKSYLVGGRRYVRQQDLQEFMRELEAGDVPRAP